MPPCLKQRILSDETGSFVLTNNQLLQNMARLFCNRTGVENATIFQDG